MLWGKTRQEGRWGGPEVEGVIFKKVIRASLNKNRIVEEIPEGDEEAGHVDLEE